MTTKPRSTFINNQSRYYGYVADFSNIPAGSNASASVRIDGGTDFLISELAASFQLNGAYNTAIDGAPLALEASPTGATGTAATSNNMPSLAHLRVQITLTDNPQFSLPVRLDMLAGNSKVRNWLSKKIRVAGNDVAIVQVFNDGPAPVKGQLLMLGEKIARGF